MRAAFVSQLIKEAGRDRKIMLLTGDLGFRYLESFARAFPKRFINVGVAESNLVTVAAGLAAAGWKPFVYSIATFMTSRPYEFIRDTISIQNLPVKIVGIGGGLAYSHAGPTHHSIDDIGLMRMLSNIAIVAPCDQHETSLAVSALARWKGPAYLRLERNPSRKITRTRRFVIGKGYFLKKGRVVALLATGTKAELALDVEGIMHKKDISATVCAFPTISPIDTSLINRIAGSHQYIATIEEHRVDGGFGSSVLEHVSTRTSLFSNVSVFRFGLPLSHARKSGSYEWLCEQAGFTKEAISKRIMASVGK